jgi:hypothetical protein
MMATAAAPPAAAAAARAGVAGPQSALPWLPQAEAPHPVGTGHWLTQQELTVSSAVQGRHVVPLVQQIRHLAQARQLALHRLRTAVLAASCCLQPPPRQRGQQ